MAPCTIATASGPIAAASLARRAANSAGGKCSVNSGMSWADAAAAATLLAVEREVGRVMDVAPTPIALIAMGKWGGRELNYASDIDVLFVYRDEGEGSAVYANKVAERYAMTSDWDDLWRTGGNVEELKREAHIDRTRVPRESHDGPIILPRKRMAMIDPRRPNLRRERRMISPGEQRPGRPQ